MKIAFAASRNLSIEIIRWVVSVKDEYNIEIVGGIAPNFNGWWDDKVKDLYDELGINIYSSIEELIDVSNPDMVFSLNYWKIIPEEYIKKVRKGIINIHHSYKLRFRGRYSTSWAIMHARKDNNWWHGSTIHFIDKELDNGAIIATERCLISEEDTAKTLFNKVEELSIEMFKNNFGKILSETFEVINPDSEYFYYGIDSNKNLEISKDLPFEDIYDFVRAWSFEGRPKPFIQKGDKKVFLSL